LFLVTPEEPTLEPTCVVSRGQVRRTRVIQRKLELVRGGVFATSV
jgi:hypothetical protein